MRNPWRPAHARWLLLTLVILLSGCGAIIADYSAEAYKTATSLKAETLALVKKSGEPYVRHKSAADELSVKIDAAYEYAAGLPNNDLSEQQWALLRGDAGIYGRFVVYWKEHRTVSNYLRGEYTKQITRSYDYIICLEVIKRVPKECNAN